MLHLDIQRAAPFFRGFRRRDRGGKDGLGHRSVLVSVLGVAILAGSAIHRGQSQGTQQVDFDREIQPIFRVSCYACHQEGNATAQLRLDNKDAAFKGGVSGRIIVPGNSRESLLIQRLTAEDAKVRMPFGITALPPEKIELMRAWIDQGAPWPEKAGAQKHWAYVPPERPTLPAVGNASWVRNPIDQFILARLEKEGLGPSPEASREVLIRRLSLNLIGLPPSVEEIDAFLADQSPNAYEKLVDRLLASPRYGERWARPWLDLARYADTNGYANDRRRSIWLFRDWVIQSLNDDMPFDQFTIEQIAGDMLPNATRQQLIATGFHRNTMINQEGGVDPEETYWEALVDRVSTTGTVWLGSTIGCSQCHDHKYDPFAQREFYELMAFFNNIERKPQGARGRRLEPELDVPTPEQDARRKELQDEINKLEPRLEKVTPELGREQTEWERAVVASESKWTPLVLTELRSTNGTVLSETPEKTILASGENPREETYIIEARVPAGITGVRLEALPHESLPRGGPGRDGYGNFVLADMQIEADSPYRKVTLGKIEVDNGSINNLKFKQLWLVDASREDKRLPRQLVFLPQDPIGSGAETPLRISLRFRSVFSGQAIGHLRISVTTVPDPKTIVNITHALRPVLKLPESQRTQEQKKELADFHLSVAPSLDAVREQVKTLQGKIVDLGILSTLVLKEVPMFERPSVHLRVRGSYVDKGDLVYANVPAVLPPLPDSEAPNRLGLARWLVSKENPLTARVAVNRFWEQYFGTGLVRTSEDFGSQGERPSHPELLDWLALEFMDQKWSMKAMHRLIVTSATYRQSSQISPALEERDPGNRLLARGPRYRLEAEMIRDVVLAASGLLSHKMGGPGVFPHQPDGVWDMADNADQWEESQGEDRYRRAVYTFWRRTAPYPSMLNFDATSREVCTARRVNTNTPLQALTTLNDPAFFEAAQALGRRIVEQGGADSRSRATYGFRVCISRKPSAGELDQILTGYEREHAFFAQHPEDTAKLVGKGGPEVAAWTMVANVLLNLDETLSKE